MMTSCALNDTARAIATICWMAVEKSSSGRRTSISTSKRLQQLGRLGVHPPPVDQAEAPGFAAEEDVLGDRAERHEVDLLVDGADAAALRFLRRGEIDRPTGEQDRTAVAAVGAGQHLDQGRLAGAVLADQRHDFARRDFERSWRQRLHALEALVDVAHGEERSGHATSRPWRLESAPPETRPPAGNKAGGRGLDKSDVFRGSIFSTRSAALPWRCWRRRSGRG